MALDVEIANSFKRIPQIESVYVLRHDHNLLRIFAIVDEENSGVYDQIYDLEIEIEDRWPLVKLDFNIIARRNRQVHEFIGTLSPAWERSAHSGNRTRAS